MGPESSWPQEHKSKPLDPVISQMNPINPILPYILTLILVLSLPLCLNPTVVIFAATSEIP